MTSLQPLLLAREYGETTPEQLKSEVKRKRDEHISRNLLNDCFSSRTFTLEKGLDHRFFYDRDSISVLSMKPGDASIKRVALFSLLERRFLWDVETDLFTLSLTCTSSSSGIAVIGKTRIFENGVQTGVLHEVMDSIHVVGQRIFGYFPEFASQGPVSQNYYFGEWDKEGNSLTRISLPKKDGRIEIVCNEHFWVHFCKSNSSVEISSIDLRTKTLMSFILNGGGTSYSNPYIVGTKLFFVSTQYFIYDPTPLSMTYVYDLHNGKLWETYSNEDCTGTPSKLIANENYAVWLSGKNRTYVKYLNLQDKKVQVTDVFDSSSEEVTLSFQGTMLSVIQRVLSSDFAEDDIWMRRTFDLTTKKFKSYHHYIKPPGGDCSQLDGVFVITGTSDEQERLYIEDFSEGKGSKDETTFRINQE